MFQPQDFSGNELVRLERPAGINSMHAYDFPRLRTASDGITSDIDNKDQGWLDDVSYTVDVLAHWIPVTNCSLLSQ